MTPEVQERIAQIRRGEIPDGYKRGKLSIVPMEWDDVPFASLFVSTSDYTDDLETYPLYSLTLEDGITAKTERYDRSHLVKKSESYKIVRPNDFAYNPMNIRLGAVARHKDSCPVAVSGYYDIFTTVSPDDLAFMDSFLTCAPMITYYNKISTGSLVEKQRVHFSQFLEFSLPLPPLGERQKIGAILSTQDTVIELQERLLTEKRRQKKYLMQRLLTGKQRLPGFCGKWQAGQFGDVFHFIPNNTYSRERMTALVGEIRNVHYGDILVKYHSVIDCGSNDLPFLNDDVKISQAMLLKSGDIIIADTAEDLTAGKAVEIINVADNQVVSGLHTMACRPVQDLFTPKWLGYYMSSDAYHNQLIPLICGTKVPSISRREIMNTTVAIPTIEEQAAIVEILSTADWEIDLLRASLEQEKRKKKALSQLLLTGIVRCISNE